MAKGIYVGIDDKSRKVKKLYVGIGNKAKRVYHVFVGVNGKARLVYEGPGLYEGSTFTYYSGGIKGVAGAAAGSKYGIFAGGWDRATNVSGGSARTLVTAYDANFTKTTPSSQLSTEATGMAGGSIGDYALFAGGFNSRSGHLTKVTTYNSSLTRGSASSLGYSNRDIDYPLCHANVGDYVFFGGVITGKYIYRYNSSLTKSNISLPIMMLEAGATSAGNKAYGIIAGGYVETSKMTSNVYAFNINFTRTSCAALSESKAKISCAFINGYGIFAGGYKILRGTTGGGHSETSSDTCDVYNSELTKVTMTVPKYSHTNVHASLSFQDHFIIGGDIYDKNLTKCTSQTRYSKFGRGLYWYPNCGYCTYGNNGLIIGGQKDGSSLISTGIKFHEVPED